MQQIKRAVIILIFGLLWCSTIHAQLDTIKVVSYNTLNFDSYSGSCPGNLNYKKYMYMRDIFRYMKPDIIALEKMNLAPSYVNDSIPAFVLDSLCKGCWSHGTLTSYSGYSKCNMLYFNKNKFGIFSTKAIYTADGAISDIDLYQLYYKDSALVNKKDTIFLNIIVVHDLSGGSNSAQRTTEITGAMNWLDAHVHKLTNYMFLGDFNVKGSTEGCFQAMINPTNLNLRFNEPTGVLGGWSGSPSSYASYLTQSTRTATLSDCGASGGLSNWFDHILCSDFIMNGTDAFTYVPKSFAVLGQDGKHAQKALIDAPTNTSAPAYIINDLYYMSEHLPISLKLAINPAHRYVAVNDAHPATVSTQIACSYVNGMLNFHNEDLYLAGKNCALAVYDCVGKMVMRGQVTMSQVNTAVDVSNLPKGCYIISMQHENMQVCQSRIIKM